MSTTAPSTRALRYPGIALGVLWVALTVAGLVLRRLDGKVPGNC